MEGRRVTRRSPKRNPLYVLFLCLVAAVFILLIVTIVLGAKLSSTNKALEAAQQQIEQIQKTPAPEQEEQQPAENLPQQPVEKEEEPDPAPQEQNKPNPQPSKKVVVGWLDLTGHNEVTVLPETVFNDYYTYYATDGVNLRSGPSTSHSKITLVEKGTKVKAAAKDSGWTFVSVGNKFGWIKTDYLSTNPPAAATTTGGNSGATAEATSGSLRTQ